MRFATWEFFFQHYNLFEIFFGVGGRGRRPLNPPTPRDEGRGVWVNKKTRVRREIV